MEGTASGKEKPVTMIQAGAPWGVALLKRVHVSQQYALAAKTDDSIMGYIKRNHCQETEGRDYCPLLSTF